MPKKETDSKGLQLRVKFREQVLDSRLWISQAEELIEVSRKLEPSIKRYWLITSTYFNPKAGTYNPPPKLKPKKLLQATYFMLAAYAIENYLTAVLVARNKERYGRYILATGNLPKDLKTIGHDLVGLLRSTKLNVTQSELSFLTRLSQHSVWQGRYPVPSKADDLNIATRYNGKGFDFKAIGLWPCDVQELKVLISRIAKLCSTR
jgi:hypothetical protein